MTKTRKVLYTVGASFVAGLVFGLLYAPNEGAETRKKIRRVKQKLGFSVPEDAETDRDTLEELRSHLRKELDKIDARLEKNVV
jgi:gas vesicle protein